MEWASLTGISPDHPLVGAGGEGGFNINVRWGRVITRPYSQSGPAADTIASPEGGTTHMAGGGLGHWRDIFNFRGSATPWLLVILVVIVFLSHLKLSAKGSAGGFGKHVRAGAALE